MLMQEFVEKQDLDLLNERFSIMSEKIEELVQMETDSVWSQYFKKTASFLQNIFETFQKINQNSIEKWSFEQLKATNEQLYQDILPKNYDQSYANPDYAVEKLGDEAGKMLSFLYVELRSLIPAVFEQKKWELLLFAELFVEIYTICNQEEEPNIKEIKEAINFFEKDYSDLFLEERFMDQMDKKRDFATKIVEQSDLTKPDYLYYFGEYVGEDEVKTVAFLNSLSKEEIKKMASTYTEGYEEGFAIAGIDLSKKKVVNIRYNLGFELIVKEAIKQFRAMGLEPVIYRCATKSQDKKQHLKIGYTSISPNPQYDYDHRFDDAIYFDKNYADRKIEHMKIIYEKHKELCAVYAGPAVMEVFGEQPYEPLSKENAIEYSTKQQKLKVELQSETNMISNQYLKQEEISFTIIAYPIPAIGEQYPEIFRECVKVNTLDKELYKGIQQSIIDALDQADYVHVKGMGENRTDICVNLHTLNNPDKETNFENCLADVNIPVGEVFTSPVLKNTNGILHVSNVFLNDLAFKGLEIKFEDGMVADYSCENFEQADKNKAFIKENLLNHRDTLPIGEFAIGTNTTAYAMAQKYDILHRLPILIVEKMGPHFAVGDTCYSHSEEVILHNPDGKEIIAKENECSRKRKEAPKEAYFNCHTDITIPYEEIGYIEAVTKSGETIRIIENGHFVLEGTKQLNEAL